MVWLQSPGLFLGTWWILYWLPIKPFSRIKSCHWAFLQAKEHYVCMLHLYHINISTTKFTLNVYELTFSLGRGGAVVAGNQARQLPSKRLLFKPTSSDILQPFLWKQNRDIFHNFHHFISFNFIHFHLCLWRQKQVLSQNILGFGA